MPKFSSGNGFFIRHIIHQCKTNVLCTATALRTVITQEANG